MDGVVSVYHKCRNEASVLTGADGSVNQWKEMEGKKKEMFSDVFVSECREASTYLTHVAAPLFRKSFQLKETARGEAVVCGLGCYELFLNGHRITKGALAPYISNPDHILYYDRYDLTPWLRKGENVIGVMLGDGFLNSKTPVWDFNRNVFNAAPKLGIRVELAENEETLTFDAADFWCKKGSVVFNDLRSGIFYDKRLEEKGWNEPGFTQDGSWHRPIPVERPRGRAKLCEAEPIRVQREIRPVRVLPGRLADYRPPEDVAACLRGQEPPEGPPKRDGGYLFDFGENNSGIFRLRLRGFKGQRIDIQCGELLRDGALDYNNMMYYPDGYVQRDIYIVGGCEEEVFEPLFTYHGFRYLYVTGLTEEQVHSDPFTYLVMSSDLEERGSFVCSEETANRIYQMAGHSDRSNFYYFPVDCPHREKNGWTGDAAASAEHMILTLGAEKSFREWLHNIRLAQREDGKLPGIVPTDTWGYDWGCGPAWDRVLFELPYCIWKYRGDTEVIRENAHAMLRYLEYIGRRDPEGIVAVGLGDWVPVDREGGDYEAPLGLTDSLMVLDMCCKSRRMFEAVGLHAHAAFAARMGTELLMAIRRKYLHMDTMLVESSCQTAQAMGLYYGIFTGNERKEAFRRLMEILKRDKEKLTCGFLGTRVLFHVLAEFGEAETAWRMITGREFPSYGYLAAQGYTTLPEQFLSDERRWRISWNHHFLGDVVQWFLRYPGGIRVTDSAHVVIRPEFLEALNYVKASHRLPAGEVSVSWKRKNGRICLGVDCPEGVVCRVETGKWKDMVDLEG